MTKTKNNLPAFADIVIVGAGAAGLFAGIFAGRAHPGRRIVILEGAKTLGAKILVAGGGRCNVTHDAVSVDAYAGSSRNAIKKVLLRFDVPETVAFFRELGVTLKREETGKLFPTTDSARTVLEALLRAAERAHVEIVHPCRVEQIERGSGASDDFRLTGEWGTMQARHVILAMGGKSLPKSGSDGLGYRFAQSFGHSLTEHLFPALVPLILPAEHYGRSLSGIAVRARLEVRTAAGKRLAGYTDALLCTHFGLSGPAALDISRHYTAARFNDPSTQLIVNWVPDETAESLEARLLTAGRASIGRTLGDLLPERLARALCESVGLDPALGADHLPRESRRALVTAVTSGHLPIMGDRGFTYAEVTAGGVPLSEIKLETMESRLCPRLHFCGEICDVDGRIGGYNFQWAWSSGYVAGVSVGG